MVARRLDQPSSRSGAALPEPTASGIAIRPLDTLAEFKACVALQERVWGDGFSEAVPVSLLQAASYVGGLAIGAFDRDRVLLGFVFGLTGVQDGRTVHWSHLLGVLDSARNLGLGRMLKEAQRAELARRGIPEMHWTFDPLIAKNAHLNLNLLGARVVKFTANMYGTTSTPLHNGLPTDRFVVACATSGAVPARHGPIVEAAAAPVLTIEPKAGDSVVDSRHPPPRIRLEIPTDFQQLMAASAARAAEWHANVRTHLQWALAHGYAVTGLHRDAVTSRSFYVLTAAAGAA
jgi:predicted GNAT superfamily acetyltransferase